MLTAVRITASDPVCLFCGCFTGSIDELREYIAKGEEKYRESRTLALDTVLTLLEANQ